MRNIYVVSDIHLFSKVAKPRIFKKFIKNIEKSASEFIILGDLFDSDNFDRPQKSHKKGHVQVLSSIRGLVDKGIKVVWVEGNHDINVIDPFCHLIGAIEISAKDSYEIEIGCKKWIFVHGHQFDTFITERPIVTAIASWFYSFIQSIDGHKFIISRWIKAKSKTLLHICKANKERAIKYASRHGGDFIVCGHTHSPQVFEENEITYINTGCWVDYEKNYLRIEENGNFFLEKFNDEENE